MQVEQGGQNVAEDHDVQEALNSLKRDQYHDQGDAQHGVQDAVPQAAHLLVQAAQQSVHNVFQIHEGHDGGQHADEKADFLALINGQPQRLGVHGEQAADQDGGDQGQVK